MKSPNLLLVVLLTLLPVALFAGRGNKQPVTMDKVTGSIIESMRDYNRVSEENEKLKEKYETMPAQTWFIVNETSESLKVSANGKSLLDLSAGAQFTPNVMSESEVKRGSSIVLTLGDKKVPISLTPGQSFGSNPTVFVDYLIGKEAWFLHIK